MKIRLRLFGPLREYLPPGATGRQVELEIPDGLNVLGLLNHLGIPYEADEGQLVVAVNDIQVEHTAPLRDGDVVSIFEPLAGG